MSEEECNLRKDKEIINHTNDIPTLQNKTKRCQSNDSSSHLTTIGSSAYPTTINYTLSNISPTNRSRLNSGASSNGSVISPETFIYNNNNNSYGKFYDSDHGSSDGSVVFQPNTISPTVVYQNNSNWPSSNNNNSLKKTIDGNNNVNISLSMLPYPQRRIFTKSSRKETRSGLVKPVRARTSSEEYDNTKSNYYPPISSTNRKYFKPAMEDDKHCNINHAKSTSTQSYFSGSGNSAVLGTLSKQLAKDVAYFFQRERYHNNIGDETTTRSNHRPLVSWLDHHQETHSYNTFQMNNHQKAAQSSSSYFSDSESTDVEEYYYRTKNDIGSEHQPYINRRYSRSDSGEPTQENYYQENHKLCYTNDRPEFTEQQWKGRDSYQYPNTQEQYEAFLYKKQLEEDIQRKKQHKKKHKKKSTPSPFQKILSVLDIYISNIPLTMGAVACSFASLSTIWFKFFEEMTVSCIPVHYHSNRCFFQEYPSCYSCDTNDMQYKLALGLHYTLLSISFALVMLVCMKCVLAPSIFIDEMSSPITAAPFGYACICIVIVFAGKGLIGRLVVCFTSFLHLIIFLWFLYLTLAYRTLPEPSWYPNTTAIGICAVKIWMYYPTIGVIFMVLSLSSCIILLPISLCRTAFFGKKLSATASWMQMSAPSHALYALTIMAQPNKLNGEYPEGISLFQQIHRIIYLPFMHLFFLLSVIAALSSIYDVKKRWRYFMGKPFSPAFAAFTCPQLTHANAIQSYRSALNTFSTLQSTHPYRIFITYYWITFLILGTLVSTVISIKYLYNLQSWIEQSKPSKEEDAPAPDETIMCNFLTVGDDFISSYVSPAILQANETGILYKVSSSSKIENYKRTKRMLAVGFVPTLNSNEMVQEHQLLLDYVAKHHPIRSSDGEDANLLSVPGIDFHCGFDTIPNEQGKQKRNMKNRY